MPGQVETTSRGKKNPKMGFSGFWVFGTGNAFAECVSAMCYPLPGVGSESLKFLPRQAPHPPGGVGITLKLILLDPGRVLMGNGWTSPLDNLACGGDTNNSLLSQLDVGGT